MQSQGILNHEVSFAREVADRILFMEDGVIVEDAPPEEFFEHPKNERIRKFIRKVEVCWKNRFINSDS